MTASLPTDPTSLTEILDDEERRLVLALRRGDEAAFGLLLDLFDPLLRRLARAYASDPAAVDDLVQATWLALLDELEAVDGQVPLESWLRQRLACLAGREASLSGRLLTEPTPVGSGAGSGEDGRPATPPEARARLLAAFRAWKTR